MSLGDLSEHSGVAKSIISQIERNETNPTLSTVYRLSRALDTTIDEVLRTESKAGLPRTSAEIGYADPRKPGWPLPAGHRRAAEPGGAGAVVRFPGQAWGVLESDPHPPGTVEHLYMLEGEVEVTSGEETRRVKAGEALRFRGDLPHKIVNVGEGEAHATMVLVLRQLGGGAPAAT